MNFPKMVQQRAFVFSRGLYKLPRLARFVGVDQLIFVSLLKRSKPKPQKGDIVIGWGQKENTAKAQQFAQQNALPYLTLEDGFLRSVGLGVEYSPALSLIIDDLGIYYDARRPSRLESLIKDTDDDVLLLQRAAHCIKRIVQQQLSKYNHSPRQDLGLKTASRILLIDQTAGDLSIQHGLANSQSFSDMLAAALTEHPEAEIIIKTHPDVIAGKKQGHLTSNNKRVRLVANNINPIDLLTQVDHVYTVTSQMGFEALMLGKAVTCFGAPFYAGWGLTDDRIEIARRDKNKTLQQVFAAAYILYPRYIDPETNQPCEIERVIEHLSLQRQMFNNNSGTLYCLGFGLWKQGYVRRYLHSPWGRIKFINSAAEIIADNPGNDARIVIWGMRDTPEIQTLAHKQGIPIWRMEDGFLRSIGLGAGLTAPASLVLDKAGIYFDATRPSDLETILQHSEFSESDLARAKALQQRIVASGLSKYNLGRRTPLQHQAQPQQTIILVPGQVEADASIKQGCPSIKTNAALLRAVRESNPEAYIIYKPHPDVLSGHRQGKRIPTGDCDLIVTDVAIGQCLDSVDEVHTMTSLVGFEALLRGKHVVTYGIPFYAGWGLSKDHHTIPRRTRQLSLNELIAATLIHYPRYIHPKTAEFATPEYTLSWLEHCLEKSGEACVAPPWFFRQTSKAKNFFKGVLTNYLRKRR